MTVKKMNKDELKNRISLALKDPILQQGFEIICKNLVELEKEKCELLGIIQGKDKVIENMKCCGNCEHFDFNEPNYCHKGIYREGQYVCAEWNWELRS